MDSLSVEARSFNSTEISEINQYLTTNIPYSLLQQYFPLTENSQQKAEIFISVYRILNSAKNYVESEETRNKLKVLLDECSSEYAELYELIILLNSSSLNYGKYLFQKQISLILTDAEKNKKINKLIDIFLIFAEKQVLLETNKVAGLEMDIEEGREFYKKINSN